jgi:hypothetical protein
MRRRFVVLACVTGLVACAPAHDPPPPAPATTDTSGAEAPRTGDPSQLPEPPSSTLRAPADDRREEVTPDTGLPPPQSQ